MPSLSKSTLDRLDVAAVLAGADVCFRFAALLDVKAKELEATGDSDGSAVLALLSVVCTYALRPDDVREPYGPRLRDERGRTASVEDLDDAQLAFLADIFEDLPVAELRARVADVLFVRRRHHRFGRCAVDAYLESADRLMKPDDWVDASYRLERALSITASVKAERDRVVAKMTDEVNKKRIDNGYFSAKVMQAFLDNRLGEPTALIPIADEAARTALAAKDWDRAREYFALLGQWKRKAGDSAGELQARHDAANCYVEQAASADSRTLEGVFLERAIQSLRSIAGTQAEVEKLHARLVEVGRESLKELKEHSSPLDLGENPDRARAYVTGQSAQAAIMRMSLLWQPQPIATLREAVLRTARQAVAVSTFPRVMANRYGKVIAKRGSLLIGTDEQRELVLRQMMFERAALRRAFITVSTILPARAQVADEHYISYRDLMPFTAASNFVPPGREEPFAIGVGLAAGFNGDFGSALHMLMPQFEHGVRSILAARGTITSKIDEDGIQDERDLGWLLTCDDAPEAFGEDLVFDMRGLLIERWGSNLRNLMAHGLIEIDEMVAPASTYLWWLTLYMVVRPLIPEAPDTPSPPAAPSETDVSRA